MFYTLYHEILYRPLFNALVYLYNVVPGHDIGLAIIFLTVLIKVVLLPLGHSAMKSQKALQDLQPKVDELKARFKDNKEELAKETMILYKANKVNPLSSCLPILIQLPILIAVYRVFQHGLASTDFEALYSFVVNPGKMNTLSLGFIDMAKASWGLAILAGAAQYVQTKMLMTKPAQKVAGAKDENMLASMNMSMQYFMPMLTVVIGMSLPAGLTFYWFLTTILTAFQQIFVFKTKINFLGKKNKAAVIVIDKPVEPVAKPEVIVK